MRIYANTLSSFALVQRSGAEEGHVNPAIQLS